MEVCILFFEVSFISFYFGVVEGIFLILWFKGLFLNGGSGIVILSSSVGLLFLYVMYGGFFSVLVMLFFLFFIYCGFLVKFDWDYIKDVDYYFYGFFLFGFFIWNYYFFLVVVVVVV